MLNFLQNFKEQFQHIMIASTYIVLTVILAIPFVLSIMAFTTIGMLIWWAFGGRIPFKNGYVRWFKKH